MKGIKRRMMMSKGKWEVRKLGEIGTIFTGNSINAKTKKQKYSGLKEGVPYIATKDVGFDNVIDYNNGIKIPFKEKDNFKIVPSNTPIICIEGGSAGRKIAFTNQTISFGNKLLALVPNPTIHEKFIYYYYFSPAFQDNFINELTGIIGGVSLSKFKSIEIPFPILSVQQRIVSLLDEAFESIDQAKANAEKNLENAKELFESYLEHVFENKGKDWEENYLETLVDESCTLSYGIVQPGDNFESGLPVIRPTDLTKRYIDLNNIKTINPELAAGYARTKLVGDELLLCVRGTTGLVSIATSELEGGNVTRGIVPVRFNTKKILQSFGYYLLISRYFQNQIKSKTYGAALMQINIRDLRKTKAKYPSILEQKSIVSHLDKLLFETEKIEAIYNKTITNLEELRKSILEKAFNGEL